MPEEEPTSRTTAIDGHRILVIAFAVDDRVVDVLKKLDVVGQFLCRLRLIEATEDRLQEAKFTLGYLAECAAGWRCVTHSL